MNHVHQNYFVRFASGFSMVMLILGVFFFVAKSPESQGDVYLSMAAQFLAQGDIKSAEHSIRLSLKADPSSIKRWKIMGKIMKEKGDDFGVKQSLAMISKINSGANARPVYATPANLKLSLLSDHREDLY